MTHGLVGALPIVLTAGWGIVILLLDAVARGPRRGWMAYVALLGLAAAAAAAAFAWAGAGSPRALFGGMLTVDRFALLFDLIFIVAAALCLLLQGEAPGEAPALVLFAVSGMMMLAHAGDLVMVFLGIETMSLPIYVLCAMGRGPRPAEAALKYFLLGAFASAFLLYGIALLYGATGTTNLSAIAEAAARGASPIYVAGMLLVTIAFAFKVAAVPFHMWVPDVYEGAPTPVTAFMAAAVKAAGFAVALRVFGAIFARPELVFGRSGWASVLAVLSALTMIVGNVAALRQESVKRMLAWSSVAHAGYVLIGVVASGVGGDAGRTAVIFYLAAYTFTTIGAFGMCAALGATRPVGRADAATMGDFAGLGARRPIFALAMTIFLLSLGGIPPTAGFFGKLLLFQAALEHRQLAWLVLAGVLTSVVAIAYYLRVVVAMYLREPAEAAAAPAAAPGAAVFALSIAAAAVLHMGLFPGVLLTILARL
ncbi:MAG: NADH-quinone oxidoreductase subunit N [Myxococcota bacterium]|mgnify:CR=1 FL=1